MSLRIIEGDLLSQSVDVIVNPWNKNFIPWWLLLPQGVSGQIKEKGGYKPFKEIRKKGLMKTGSAFLTSAGKLNLKGIIHVAGLNVFWIATEKSIRESTKNALRICLIKKFNSIAFPLIGAGTGGIKKELVIKFMSEEISKSDFKGKVILVLYKRKVY